MSVIKIYLAKTLTPSVPYGKKTKCLHKIYKLPKGWLSITLTGGMGDNTKPNLKISVQSLASETSCRDSLLHSWHTKITAHLTKSHSRTKHTLDKRMVRGLSTSKIKYCHSLFQASKGSLQTLLLGIQVSLVTVNHNNQRLNLQSAESIGDIPPASMVSLQALHPLSLPGHCGSCSILYWYKPISWP